MRVIDEAQDFQLDGREVAAVSTATTSDSEFDLWVSVRVLAPSSDEVVLEFQPH